MKWADLRHAYYITSADFMAMLSLLHVLMFMLTGFGILRISSDINDIQDNAWSLIISTILFTLCLGASKRNTENTYPKFHRWFLPLILLLSLTTMIALSAYHGIITVLALHLVLISFVLTGFPCVILILINVVGIAVGTGFYLILVRTIYSNTTHLEGHESYIEISTSYGYGLATKSSIVMVDMTLLLLQVIGGIVFYSRFWKLGLLMCKWKNNPSSQISEFPFLLKLEMLIFNRCIYDSSEAKLSSINKNISTNPIHRASLPNSPLNSINASNNNLENNASKMKNIHENNNTNKEEKINKDNTPINMDASNQMIKIKDYNLYVEDELRDEEWLKFLEMNDKVQVRGRRTYTNEKITLNTHSSEGQEFRKKNSYSGDSERFESYYKYSIEAETTDKYSVSSNTNIQDVPESRDLYQEFKKDVTFENLETKTLKICKNTTTSTYDNRLSELTQVTRLSNLLSEAELEMEKEAPAYDREVQSAFFHHRSYGSNLSPRKEIPEEDKLLNINVNIENPVLKILYVIMPSSIKRLMRKSLKSSSSLRQKREMIYNLRWEGPETLPAGDSFNFFSQEPYELLYVKWMHLFNMSFYNLTLFEIILIVLYSLVGNVLLCYRHYLTLSKSDQEAFTGSLIRQITISLRFTLYPIISLIIIIVIIFLLSKSNYQTINRIKKSKGPEKENSLKETDKKGKKNKKTKEKERIILVYWIMILMCIVDFVGAILDVFISVGLETPPYVVHNTLVMQFLMTKTAAFLFLRFPAMFVLYLIYFLGLFTSQFFMKHTNAYRYIITEVASQVVIGIGSYVFLIKPVDVNRRRVFMEVILPYVLYLSKFIN